MLFAIAVGAWITVVTVSYVNGNRILPTVVLVLGIADIIGMVFFSVGWLGLSALALMAVVMLIANRIDSIHIR